MDFWDSGFPHISNRLSLYNLSLKPESGPRVLAVRRCQWSRPQAGHGLWPMLSLSVGFTREGPHPAQAWLLPSGPEVGADGLRTGRSAGITWARRHLAGREETTPKGSETLEGCSPETQPPGSPGLMPPPPSITHRGCVPARVALGAGHPAGLRAGSVAGAGVPAGSPSCGSVSLLLGREGVRQSREELCFGHCAFPSGQPETQLRHLHVRNREGSLRPAV